MNLKNIFIKIKDFVTDALFPKDIKCIFCNRDTPSGYICNDCLKLDIFNEGNRCIKCDSPIKEDNIICDHCKKGKRHFSNLYCPFLYQGVVRKSILRFKSDGAKYLAHPFATFITQRLEVNEIDFDIIVPVPSHKNTIRKRGYNPAKVLADEIGKLLNKPVADILVKTTATKNQKYLNYEERQSNLENTIWLADSALIKNKNILIVDDIITTSATIEACASLMNKANNIYGCAIARRSLTKNNNSKK